ncbi:nucleoside-triphosphatase [Thermopolyspora sp. NPDC052614]|uniref:nucleoside-triphosphatase n=1 Tax=Thermopolyspora sp. NPDC052614 TaxID=3155682 RepID=UPI00342A1C78
MRRIHILLTAPPRTGKTTLVRRLAETLREAEAPVRGFLTDEIREEGARLGFMVTEIGGPGAVLAHIDRNSGPRVGRYRVDIAAFERIALPAIEHALSTPDAIVILDEIGMMELLSQPFVARLNVLFTADIPLVATVHERPHPVTDALKALPYVETVTVTKANRDRLPEELSRRLLA